MSAPSAGPVIKKRKYESGSSNEKVKQLCKHCNKGISCPVRSGKVHEVNLRSHEKTCKNNPEREFLSVRGLKVGEVFGSVGSDSEFQAPEHVRNFSQGSSNVLAGALHVFPDGSMHPVVGILNGKPLRSANFFSNGNRCCFDDDKSILHFRERPDLFPKLYDNDGRCVIAELGTQKVAGAPDPWPMSKMRLFSLNSHSTVKMLDLRCQLTIDLDINNCAQGQGPCRNCTGTTPDTVLYDRSCQAYLDKKGLQWTTVPAARTILANHHGVVHFTCTLCENTWQRIPACQVQNNSGCPGCEARYRAELCVYNLYAFYFPDAKMCRRGYAYLEGVHNNPFDVVSLNFAIIVEVMSHKWHVEGGRLPSDIEKMNAALRKGYVYIMVHSEDYEFKLDREFAWKRCIVAALRMAKEDVTPRIIHVRRNAAWTAYDCMRDAAMAAGFSYQDIFCGDVNAHATERLPGETHTQATL